MTAPSPSRSVPSVAAIFALRCACGALHAVSLHHDLSDPDRREALFRLPFPPGALTTRLVELDQRHPGLSRAEQARILGTSAGMVRDTVYRVRRRGVSLSGRNRHPMRRVSRREP